VSFIFNVTDSVTDLPISAVSSKPQQHPTITSLLTILSSATSLLEECPPDYNAGSRFGNPAFRTYITALTTHLPTWHLTHFPTLPPGALTELHTYLTSSFGSARRIDYGSGHELNFLVYALCLYRLALLPPPTFPALALVVFPAYLALMRRLQETYYLEPAGSHGVWGLDDYHFLPFLFGAAQLKRHAFLRPLAIHSQPTVEAYADEFLYLDAVRHVNATKTVQGLRWHSPMLDDISGVKAGWGKVCEGLKKMFEGEVLGKLVVMQHFLFGGLVAAVEGMTAGDDDGDDEKEVVVPGKEDEGEERVAEGHEGHKHNGDAWGDCCGIRVPSSVGAAQELKKRTGGQGLRRLPFD